MLGVTCPKCQSPMRSYERSGITVDQCTSCRGVFLDRGELERLVDAEASYYGGHAGAPRYEHERDSHRERGHDREDRHGGHRRHRHGREREGFLGELFDFG